MPARNIRYTASVAASAPESEISALMRHTESIVEIQNTLRQSSEVVLTECKTRFESLDESSPRWPPQR